MTEGLIDDEQGRRGYVNQPFTIKQICVKVIKKKCRVCGFCGFKEAK